MKQQLAIAMFIALLTSAVAYAAPVTGDYESEFSNQVLIGRWSESYVNGSPGQIGNTIHALSWDGSVLGGQWSLVGAAISETPTVVSNSVVNGTGTIEYKTVYSGGILTLDASGPWGTLGDSSYVVSLDKYLHTTFHTYVFGELKASITVVDTRGSFVDHDGYELSFMVAVAIPAGEGSVLPADYPAWLPETATTGAYGVAQKISLGIIPEPATMSLMGLGLVVMIVRRRELRRAKAAYQRNYYAV